MDVDGKNWDQLLPHVHFATREVPQASTGFSPFKLLYERRLGGILDLATEAWESQPSPHRTMPDHVEQVRDCMAQVWTIVRDHLRQAQEAQAQVYNRGAQLRIFRPGIWKVPCQMAGALRGGRPSRGGELPGTATRETQTHPALSYQPPETVEGGNGPPEPAPLVLAARPARHPGGSHGRRP